MISDSCFEEETLEETREMGKEQCLQSSMYGGNANNLPVTNMIDSLFWFGLDERKEANAALQYPDRGEEAVVRE